MAEAQADVLEIDGSYGEGGGQILRTALSLAVALGRPFRMRRIRAGRPKPGLRPQHLVAVRAAAAISGAAVEGDRVGSQDLLFAPQHRPAGGDCTFDVGATEAGGSAGAVSLVFQALFLPLALAGAPSHLTLVGGTHVPWSPPFHYLAHVYLPAVAALGYRADLAIQRWGWYPKGGGVVQASIQPRDATEGAARSLDWTRRGRLTRVWGISAASNLPEHIVQRQKVQALEMLRKAGLRAEIEEAEAPAMGFGTVVFLVAEYERGIGGFTAYGALRKPAERVAEEAARELIRFHETKAAVDEHLADQLLLPAVLVGADVAFTTPRATDHLRTNAWAIEQFLGPRVEIEPHPAGALVRVRGGGQAIYHRDS
ncbi:MAG: RNA 3'-terminal phosphate cyclase [Anaerolineales bacterium]